MAESSNVDRVRVLWVDAQSTDLLRFCQSNMRPGVTRVGRFVDAVAVRGISADIPFAHAGVNHVRVGVGYRDCSHRTEFQLTISDETSDSRRLPS